MKKITKLSLALASVCVMAGCGGDDPAPQTTKPDVCADIDCGGNGMCVTAGGVAACLCNSGYDSSKADDGTPICAKREEGSKDPCEGITCADHGMCLVNGGTGVCLCDSGYERASEGGKSTCKKIESTTPDPGKPDFCAGIDCGGNGACVTVSSGAACMCNEGFQASYENGKPTCVERGTAKDVCEDVECGDHGTCVASAKGGVCLCDTGYEVGTSGKCEESKVIEPPPTTNACASISCGGKDKGSCIETSDGAACWCNDGYVSLKKDGKVECVSKDSPDLPPTACDNVDCSGKGSCIVTNNDTAYCLCDAGYTQSEATQCVENPNSICSSIDCTSNGACVENGGKAYCLCAYGYEQTINDGKPTCTIKDVPPVQEDACANETCNGHGTCLTTNGNVAFCLCSNGYHLDGDSKTNCVEDEVVVPNNPCEDQTCDGHGKCLPVSEEEGYCLCDSGYVNDGALKCVEKSGSDANKVCAEKNVDCGGHGSCLETVAGTAYCVCENGYHAKITEDETVYTCVANNEVDPCKDQKCSYHGTCKVKDGVAICECFSGYKNESNLVCVWESEGSGGNANGGEKKDPWGLVWDKNVRDALTHEKAAKMCKSLNGRLPTPTEIYRNNHSSGAKGVGTEDETTPLWTSYNLWDDQCETMVVADGSLSSAVRTTKLGYRCVWDPEPRPITLRGVNCNGNKDDKEQCVQVDANYVTYTVDARDRMEQYWFQAAEECRAMGGRLPSVAELNDIIWAGAPNGSNQYLWTSEGGNNSTLRPVRARWSGVQNSNYAMQNNVANGLWNTKSRFRCISEQVELDNDNQPIFPQKKVETAFKVDPLLYIDEAPRSAANWWDAGHTCMNDGGHLATADELSAAIRAGLQSKTTNWILTSNLTWERVNLVLKWDTDFVVPYWNINGNLTQVATNAAYQYYCAYRPNREFDSEVIDQIEEKVAKEEIFKTKSVATHYVLNKNVDSTGKNMFVDSYNSTARGMLLPTAHELAFAIKKGLPGGSGNWITTSSVWATDYNLGLQLLWWKGTGVASYNAYGQCSYTGWNGTYGYRSYISSVIR